MLEEKTQDLMVNMQAVLPLIVTNALNALGAIVILLIGLWLSGRLGLRPRRHRQEAPQPGRLALHIAADPLGHPFRENTDISSTCSGRFQMLYFANN
jgi:hypothetical protein